MKIKLTTKVRNQYQNVMEMHEQGLIDKIKPLLFNASIKRFDGYKLNDIFHIEFNFFILKEEWVGKITYTQENKGQISFIDEGVKLPFSLKEWRHKHSFLEDLENENETIIVDDIFYTTGSEVKDMALFPFLFSHYLGRKLIYKIFLDEEMGTQIEFVLALLKENFPLLIPFLKRPLKQFE